MSSGGGVDVPVHDLDRAVALLAEGAELLAGVRTWSRSQEEVRGALAEVCRLANVLEAGRLNLVRGSVAHDDGETAGACTQAWLVDAVRVSGGRARADVENAALVDPDHGDLRELGRALAAGEVSPQHVDVARQALHKIPSALVRGHRAKVAAALTRNARRFAPPEMRKVAAHLISVLAPAREDRLDPHAEERRRAACFRDATGMVQVSAQLAGEGGLFFTTVLDQLSAPGRTGSTGGVGEDGQTALPVVLDDRTPAQRTADALVAMARLAASHPEAGTRGSEPPRLVIHTSVEQLAWVPGGGLTPPGLATCDGGHPISPGLLQRLACDAVLQTVVLDCAGAIVEMRSPQRLANRAQRRALAARDGGCAHPGCAAPPTWCDTHHVVFWSRGGRTVLENLVLLCPRHHTLIHAEEWVIQMRDGVPWFVPPRHLDPHQRPVRNTLHTAIAETTALAQQLWHDTDPPGADPPGADPPDVDGP